MGSSASSFAVRRRARLRELMLRPVTLFPIVALPVPLAIAGQAITGRAGPALAAGLLAPVGITAWRMQQATDQAEDAVMTEWGASHGLTFTDDLELPGDAPLLRAGDRRRAENGLFALGEVNEGLIVCHYIYTVESRGSKGRRRSDDRTFTVCHLKVRGTGWSALPRLRLHRRGSLDPHFGDRLQAALTPERLVQLESVEFNDAYKLFVSDNQDEVAVRAFFTPAAAVWLVEQAPPGFMFEMELNTLVAALPGRVRDPGLLDALLDSARRVANHIEQFHAYEETTVR